jgi:hypothetical protein
VTTLNFKNKLERKIMETKYPFIKIKLTDEDGNAFAIMGRVIQALKMGLLHTGYSLEQTASEIKEYHEQAISGDYDNLLRVTMTTVNCE